MWFKGDRREHTRTFLGPRGLTVALAGADKDLPARDIAVGEGIVLGLDSEILSRQVVAAVHLHIPSEVEPHNCLVRLFGEGYRNLLAGPVPKSRNERPDVVCFPFVDRSAAGGGVVRFFLERKERKKEQT